MRHLSYITDLSFRSDVGWKCRQYPHEASEALQVASESIDAALTTTTAVVGEGLPRIAEARQHVEGGRALLRG
jgi:hypothetical protein